MYYFQKVFVVLRCISPKWTSCVTTVPG